MSNSSLLFFDDFVIGQIYSSPPRVVDAEMIKNFAQQYDPQPFHLDEEVAKNSFFKGLVASGWHTAAMTMRMIVDALPIAGGAIGAGVEQVKWPLAVRPGDELHASIQVLELRDSRSKPELGLIKVQITTLNQDKVIVQDMIANLVVPKRQ
ncbi:MAG: MaoC family dehydratase [Gammaproteobacteria bacterium]|nr:MaoC family dehydratase [Gammaproteobacteria bacterium]